MRILNPEAVRVPSLLLRVSWKLPGWRPLPGSSTGAAPIVGVARGEGAGPGGAVPTARRGARQPQEVAAAGRGFQSGADRPDLLRRDRGKCRATVGTARERIPPVLLLVGGVPRGHGAVVGGAAETRAWEGREAEVWVLPVARLAGAPDPLRSGPSSGRGDADARGSGGGLARLRLGSRRAGLEGVVGSPFLFLPSLSLALALSH